MSDSLRPHESQHTRPPCPSPTPGLHPNSCVSSRWRHPAISSSVTPVSSCPQSFSESGSFSMSQLFASGDQSIGALASASVFSMSIQGWFPIGLTGLIALLPKGLSTVFSSTTVWKHQFFGSQPFFMVQLSHPYMTTGKTIALIIWTFVSKVMSLLFNMLSRFVIAFLPRSKCSLISWLQWFWRQIKYDLPLFPIFSSPMCYEVMGLDVMVLVFFN